MQCLHPILRVRIENSYLIQCLGEITFCQIQRSPALVGERMVTQHSLVRICSHVDEKLVWV